MRLSSFLLLPKGIEMLFNMHVFVPVSDELLAAANPMEDAAKIARTSFEIEPASTHTEYLGTPIASKYDATVQLAKLADGSNGPVDYVAEVSEDGVVLGWHVCLWYNEDDDADEYYESEEGE